MARRRIKVLIADDHNLFAEALTAILATDDRFQVVGKATDGKQAVALTEGLKPDIVLMDIAMPVLDGVDAAKRIRRRAPATRILMLTGSNARQDVDRARAAGAAGYITKDRIAAELIDAIIDAAEA